MTPLEAIEKLSGQPILVLGDMIADIYLYGTIARISREAPVLVLEQSEEKIVAGGAANVINNGATLGGKIFAAGLVGNDNAAKGLVGILQEKSVDVTGFIMDANRSTISKPELWLEAGLRLVSRLCGWTKNPRSLWAKLRSIGWRNT